MSDLVPSGFMLPIHFGTRFSKSFVMPGGGYRDVTSLKVSYLTDKKQLQQYLPDCFKIVKEPIVQVHYSRNLDIEWLAGGEYNILGVDVPCLYKGNEEQMEGKYSLVLWENLTDPILTGRELQGIPKIYAEIENHVKTEGVWRTCAHYRGHKIVDITIKETRPMTHEEIEKRRALPGKDWFGWKYLPKTGEPGFEVSYPTLYPLGDATWEATWGEGKVEWNHLTWEQNPTQFHIVNALADLPILEYREATISKNGYPPPADCWWKPPPPAGPPRIWRRLR
jgi:acetoacetate decarboxylase